MGLEAKIINAIQNKLFLQRLELLFILNQKSNEWKKEYEYFQRPKELNENSIIVSET